MVPAGDVDAFVADRFGRYLVGRHFLVWCADPSLGGMVFWGVPDEQDARDVTRVLSAINPKAGVDQSYDVVTDGRRIERLNAMTFNPFAREARQRISDQRALVRRHAVIAPFGLVGAVMAGFFPLLGLDDTYRVFTDGGEAFGWLGRAAAFEEVESLVAAACGQAPVVTELQRWLSEHLRDATITSAARALARSSRSLQRELGTAKTSFRRELDHARVSAARSLLADSDEKLAVIAREIGCVSGSTFSELFRRVTGETPTEYRSRSRD